jgi:phosphoribosylformylglycinamidine synthase
MKKVKVIILRTAGTNCDKETAFAFEKAGAKIELVHINQLKNRQRRLKEYAILAIPGGFTYGDDISSGKILANELRANLGRDLEKFIQDGKLVIGICNGFQVLVKAGLLPGFAQKGKIEIKIQATLMINDCGKFEDRWVYLKTLGSRCVWTENLSRMIYLPVAHAEGKFIAQDDLVLNDITENRQVVFQYVDARGFLAGYPHNPNGSVENIAGICDASGRILGLMPHPERHILGTHSPRWTREGLKPEGDGLAIFRNGVEYAQKNL